MKKLMLILILGIMFVSFASAAENDEQSFIWEKDEVVNYSFRCFDGNGNYCESGVTCMMNIEYPNGTNSDDNASMTRTDTSYNYVMDTTTLGEYYSMIICNNGTTSVNSAFTYLVTPSGFRNTSSNAIMYSIIMFVLLILFVGSMIWWSNVPWGHYTNYEGDIVQVNEDRTKKIALFFFAYITLMLLLFTGKAMAESYMWLNDTPVFFDVFFNILLVAIAPVTIITFIFAVITTVANNKLGEALMRGF